MHRIGNLILWHCPSNSCRQKRYSKSEANLFSFLKFHRVLWIVLWFVLLLELIFLYSFPPGVLKLFSFFSLLLGDKNLPYHQYLPASCFIYFEYMKIHWCSKLLCLEVILGLLFVTFSFTVLGAHVIVFLGFIFPFATVNHFFFPEKVCRCLHVWKWIFAYLSFCMPGNVLYSLNTWLIFGVLLYSK